ncbi:MAG: hypothetical protein H9917_11500 [Candidatus Oceanisphaera merdipullorum]|nr:hypothetical protein [Candidatus Oceanisphaera merdipullorum]
MADQLTDKDLCEALSDLFVDNHVDYDAIASVAKHFPLRHVETVLFEWVAPVCHTNTLAPIPSVWSGFEPEQLWRDIAEHRGKEARAGLIERGISRGRQLYLRQKFAQEWRELAKRISTAQD